MRIVDPNKKNAEIQAIGRLIGPRVGIISRAGDVDAELRETRPLAMRTSMDRFASSDTARKAINPAARGVSIRPALAWANLACSWRQTSRKLGDLSVRSLLVQRLANPDCPSERQSEWVCLAAAAFHQNCLVNCGNTQREPFRSSDKTRNS